MSKPDWKDAPEWAQFLAMDGDGEWWWYEEEPYWRHERNRWGSSAARCISHQEHMSGQVNGNGSLERRP